MKKEGKGLILKISNINNPGTGYLYLPNHPGENLVGIAVKQIAIQQLINNYKGVDIYLDFDKNNELIGIEILDD